MTRGKSGRIVVAHLRTSSGSGGGPEKTIFNTASRIDRDRFDYLAVYLHKHGEDLSGIKALAARHGAELVTLPGRGVADAGQLAALIRLVRDRGVAILHGHEPKSDLLIRLLGVGFPRIRRVTTLHGFVVRPGSRKSAFYVGLDKRLLPSFQAVIAVSGPLAQLAKDAGAKNVQLLHNAVDADFWSERAAVKAPVPDMLTELWPDDGAEAFTVGYIGRLSPEKGILDFLRVARRLCDASPVLRFAVAGHGPQAGEAKALAARLDLDEQVRFLGQITPEAARTLHTRLSCLLSPSHTEGLPNHLLEAMAMGTPVVATDVGGVAELVADGATGLLRPAGDVDGMARAVLALSRDPARSAALADAARTRVAADFSFARRTARLMALYETLVGRVVPGTPA